MARTLASAYAVAGLLLAACSTAPAIDSTPGQPILCGDFVDANGAPLANCSFGVNLRFENGVVGGWGGISDQNGEFRIDTGLGCLRRAEDSERTLLLVGEGDLEARIDVRRAFGPGVHHLGEVVLADPCDARALRRMSDAA